MYEFAKKETGWLFYWGPPPQATERGPRLREEAARPAAAGISGREDAVNSAAAWRAAAQDSRPIRLG
jgi:hypothetical protein